MSSVEDAIKVCKIVLSREEFNIGVGIVVTLGRHFCTKLAFCQHKLLLNTEFALKERTVQFMVENQMVKFVIFQLKK